MNEYCIISVDDSRADNKNLIRAHMSWKEADISFVDARIPSQLKSAKLKWQDVSTPGPFKAGEFGIFYSVLNALEYGAQNDGILYFEDDAILADAFQVRIEAYLEDLPRTADLFAVWSPENQRRDYDIVRTYNSLGEPQYGEKRNDKSIFDFGHSELARLWQGYGNVSMFFTKHGCRKTIKYIREKGFFSPVDCLLCIGCHSGRINGYALKPTVKQLINYDWSRKTTIHTSKWGMIDQLMEEI